ncbi:MAG: glycoside hydrolase [Chitinispirillia bacterium]|jgi:glucuronoarabinoxylan endo-1,4-beta-xylanase
MNSIRRKPAKPGKYMLFYAITLLQFNFILYSSAYAQTITVNWDKLIQEIDGFGASAAFKQADNLKKFPIETRTKILDLLFSHTGGIGLSMVRNMVGDGSIDEWGNEVDGPIETINPQKGKWNFDAVDEQIWFMKEARARGCERFYSTVWSPPRWMKTNNSCLRGGSLKKSCYGDYAEYLYQYVTEYMKKRNDIDMYAISVANEPDYSASYSSCRWTGDQFRNFIRDHIGPKFKDENKIETKIAVGEEMGWTEGPAMATLNDPKAVKYLDIVASHNYKNASNYPPFRTSKSKNKRVWQTEVSNLKHNNRSIDDGLKWARQIHDFLTNAEGNSWCYWWTICYKVNPPKGEALININTSNKTYFTNKRLYTMGNYSRFIRPGWYRISTSMTSSNNVYVTAFKNPKTNDFAIVAINNDRGSQTRSFKLHGYNINTVAPYVTSSSKDLAKGDPVSLSNGSFSAGLPAKSVTTFYGKSEVTEVNGGKGQSFNTDHKLDLSISVVNSRKLIFRNTIPKYSFDGIFTIYSLSGKKLIQYKLTDKKSDRTVTFSLPVNMGSGIYCYRFVTEKTASTGILQLVEQF